MTRLNEMYGGVNLRRISGFSGAGGDQGGGVRRINADINQYAVTWGARPLREAVAREFTRRYGLPIVADEQVTCAADSTEAMIVDDDAIIDPGDEVVMSSSRSTRTTAPTRSCRRDPRYVTLHEPDWTFDPDELAAVFNEQDPRPSSSTPEQPDGKGLHARRARDEFAALFASGRHRHLGRDLRAHHLRRPPPHPDATIEGMADRTVTLNGWSKTYSVTGWRVGWTISPPSRTGAFAKCTTSHGRRGGAVAGRGRGGARSGPTSTTRSWRRTPSSAATCWSGFLERHHFTCYRPLGAYYIMTDIACFGISTMSSSRGIW